MNEFDKFVKRQLKAKYYIRFADDFVVFSTNRNYLLDLLVEMRSFLNEKLLLNLHPDKVFIKTIASGVDFLGWVHFPNHRILRTSTKWRMFRNLRENFNTDAVASYLGMLKHGNGCFLAESIRKLVK
mgnify:FL=1